MPPGWPPGGIMLPENKCLLSIHSGFNEKTLGCWKKYTAIILFRFQKTFPALS